MLKNKSREQLLEIIYKLKNDNYELELQTRKQSEVLKGIAKVYFAKGFFARLFKFFALPFTVLQILKKHKEYFLTIQNKIEQMAFTREEIKAAYKAIVAFENKKMSPSEYKDLISGMLGLKNICDTCDDVMSRLHDDFQKRVAAECTRNSNLADLLPVPPKMKSGKYCGAFYESAMKTYPFKNLNQLLSDIKTDSIKTRQRGLKQQADLMQLDYESLKAYIAQRKAGFDLEETTTGSVDLDSEGDEDIEVIEKGVLEDIENEADVETEKEPTQAAKEGKVYKDEDALALQQAGMNLEEIGKYYGVSAATVSRKLAKYKELMNDSSETKE